MPRARLSKTHVPASEVKLQTNHVNDSTTQNNIMFGWPETVYRFTIRMCTLQNCQLATVLLLLPFVVAPFALSCLPCRSAFPFPFAAVECGALGTFSRARLFNRWRALFHCNTFVKRNSQTRSDMVRHDQVRPGTIRFGHIVWCSWPCR